MTVLPLTLTGARIATSGLLQTQTIDGVTALNVPYRAFVKAAILHASYLALQIAPPDDITQIFTLAHDALEEGET